MSTTSLPSYVAPPTFARSPTYSAEPHAFEQRLALNRPAQRPAGSFVKQSKNVSLRLYAQDDNASLPVYGCGATVEGAVTLSKMEGVTAVDVKVRLACYYRRARTIADHCSNPRAPSGTRHPSCVVDRGQPESEGGRGGWDDDLQAVFGHDHTVEQGHGYGVMSGHA